MIKARGADPEALELRGIERASITPEASDAITRAEAIVIGPSNPVISIGPILDVLGVREALAAAAAPVVAVSPFVGGEVLKGPTEPFCEMAGLPLGTASVERAYAGVIDGVVSDAPDALPALDTDTLMSDAESRRRVAAETLDFARSLRSQG
jgi:LPPG:FO 2-phospho-L-lactate transferase